MPPLLNIPEELIDAAARRRASGISAFFSST